MKSDGWTLPQALSDLEDAAQALIPMLQKRRIHESFVTLAYLLNHDHLFVLLLAPHGEVLACSPYTDAALAFLREQIAPAALAVPGEPSRWANQQRWEFCVVKRIYAVGRTRHGA